MPRHSLALLLLATALTGCSTPRDAQTPGPVLVAPDGVAQSRLVVRDGHAGDASGAAATRPATDWAQAPVQVPAQLPPALASLWQATKLPDDALSLVVLAPGQTPLVAIQATTARNPASLMKLVTTYAALEGLGPSHRWRTEFGAAAGSGIDAAGRLTSPLYIRASGDPWIDSDDLRRVLRELRQRGIRSLPGIVIDRTVFGDVAIDPAAFDNAPDRVYNASPDAFLVDFGATRLRYLPSPRGSWQVVLDPPQPAVQLDNRLQGRPGRCGGQGTVRLHVDGGTTTPVVRVEGAIPTQCGSFEHYRLILDSANHAAQVLQGLWHEAGGELTGPIRAGAWPDKADVLAVHESDTLSDIIRPINKASNNVMARQLLLALGQAYQPGPATPEQGRRAVQQVLQEQGLVFPELWIDNGAGLSRDARIAAGSMAQLLEAAWRSPRMPEFVSSLAIAGADGTVRRRWRDDDTLGRAHLKTGTLRDVMGLAGYVQGASGQRYVLVSLINHPQSYNARRFVDALVDWLAQQ